MKEDKLTNAIIEKFKSEKRSKVTDKIEVEPEAHYNYYGTRGVADLFIRFFEVEQLPPSDYVFEIKSSPRNANEVIRQFQKMRKTFFKDSSRSPGERVNFELCFTPEKSNFEHIQENLGMYGSLLGTDTDSIVTIRHPDNVTPVHVDALVRDDFDFLEHCKASNPKIYELIEEWEVLDE